MKQPAKPFDLPGDVHGLVALAAVTHLPPERIARCLDHRPWTGRLTPPLLRGALARLGIPDAATAPRADARGGMRLPSTGLALLQLDGPWLKRGVAREAAEVHALWIGVRPGEGGREIFDPHAGAGAGAWLPQAEWKAEELPRRLSAHPGARGLFCALGLELDIPPAEEGAAPTTVADPYRLPVKEPPHDPALVGVLMARLGAALKGHGIRLAAPPDPAEADVGPRWVRAYIRPLPGQSIKAVRAQSEDLARAVGTLTSDIHIANLPERHAVGIDLPVRDLGYAVSFDDLRAHPSWAAAARDLTLGFCAGIDATGFAVWVDLADMPHMLVAGTTGSGKTVFLRTLLLTLVLTHPPEALQLALSSSKPMDFRPFAGLPHALGDIIQTPDASLGLVEELAREMDRRIQVIDEAGQDTLDAYNAVVEESERLPHLVAVLDEYGDTVMSFEGKDTRKAFETAVGRLAQKARAAGIHLILCMQRPEATVLGGMIKANVLHRFALKLPQSVDSRIVLDARGAEALLGQGDLLYKDGSGRVQRLQVPFLEVEGIRGVLGGMGGER